MNRVCILLASTNLGCIKWRSCRRQVLHCDTEDIEIGKVISIFALAFWGILCRLSNGGSFGNPWGGMYRYQEGYMKPDSRNEVAPCDTALVGFNSRPDMAYKALRVPLIAVDE
jgi:hypothetical protein